MKAGEDGRATGVGVGVKAGAAGDFRGEGVEIAGATLRPSERLRDSRSTEMARLSRSSMAPNARPLKPNPRSERKARLESAGLESGAGCGNFMQ